jgi:GABA permease
MRELSRSLKPRHLEMISIGGIIGAGLFVGSSASIAAVGPAVVLSYLITGTLVLLVMRMLGEMSLATPHVRSFTEFARAGLGPWAGFIAGWLYWYFWIVVVPAEAIAGANILHAWMPQVPAGVLGCVLMTLMTGVNLMSARSYGEFEFWFASIKVAAIIVFIALAGAFACGLTSAHGPTFANLSAWGGFMPYGAVSVLAGAVTVFFSLTGAEIVTIAAAESAAPSRAIARLGSSIIVRILLFYVGSVFFIVAVVPWRRIEIGQSPFALALERMHFLWAGLAMDAIILTAVLSCLNSAFYVCSRVLFVLAERGDAPQGLIRLNARRVPVRSVLLCGAAGIAGILAAIQTPQGVFAFLVDASGALMVIIYGMIALAHLRLRRARERAGTPPPRVQLWLFPWSSYVAIGAMAAILIAMQFAPGLGRDLHVSLISVGVVTLAYLIVRWRRAHIGPGGVGLVPDESARHL